MARLMVLYAVNYGNNISKFLRGVHSNERTERRIKALSSHNNPLSGNVPDAAYDHGLNLDFQHMLRAIKAGQSPEDVIKEMSEGLSTTGRGSQRLNTGALLEMSHNGVKLK